MDGMNDEERRHSIKQFLREKKLDFPTPQDEELLIAEMMIWCRSLSEAVNSAHEEDSAN
jgi:hypothetical protein